MSDKVKAWNIFFHPKRWKERVMELAEENTTLSQDNGAQASLIKDLRHEIARLESSNVNQSSKIVKLETAVKGLTSDLLKTRIELDDRKDTETQIREFDAKVSRMEKLKKSYDRRIEVLNEEIRDLKTLLRTYTDEVPGDEMNIIDMAPPKVESEGETAEKKPGKPETLFSPDPVIFPESNEDGKSDWLKPLPDM